MKVQHAMLSGFCAATASFFGKLCWLPAFEDTRTLWITFFVLMILNNAFVWIFFVKALQEVESSLKATVISAASNYCLSAGLGFLVFNEITGLFWWSGMLFIVIGLILIVQDNEVDKRKVKNKDS